MCYNDFLLFPRKIRFVIACTSSPKEAIAFLGNRTKEKKYFGSTLNVLSVKCFLSFLCYQPDQIIRPLS